MKYIILTIAALFVMGGCASADAKKDAAPKQDNTVMEDAILDEEFDLLVAPEYDYEKDVPYSEQIKNTDTAKQAKSAKKPTAVKK